MTRKREPSAKAGRPACPYPGLRPFHEDESHLFFGREGPVDEIAKRLGRRRFLGVIGPSGCGKSSLIKAGLLPALRDGRMKRAGRAWRTAIFRPGTEPVRNLARALAPRDVLGAEHERRGEAFSSEVLFHATLNRSNRGLIEATREAVLPDGENLLIVADQFEEVFRYEREGSRDEAAQLVQLLLTAAEQREFPIFVVLTMRSDFLGLCARFRELPEAISHSQYLIPRMTRDERQRMIEGPAETKGVTLSPVLVNRLLNDVSDDPYELPGLQHALMRTWHEWVQENSEGAEASALPSTPIELEHYEATGGLERGLSNHANEAFAELPSRFEKAFPKEDYGGRIVTGSSDGTARVWGVSPAAAGAEEGEGEDASKARENFVDVGSTSGQRVTCAAFSPSGRRVLVGFADGVARIWRRDGLGEPVELRCTSSGVWPFSKGQRAVAYARFGNDGEHVITRTVGGRAQVWDSAGNESPLRIVHADEAKSNVRVNAVIFSPLGRRVAAGFADGTVQIWNTDGREDPRVVLRAGVPVDDLSFAPDGESLALGLADGTARVVDVRVGSSSDGGPDSGRIQVPESGADGEDDAEVTESGPLAFVKADDPADTPLLALGSPMGWLQKLRGRHAATRVAFDATGRRLLVGTPSGEARVHDLRTGTAPVVLKHSRPLESARFAGEGRVLTVAGGRAQLWPADGAGEPVPLAEGSEIVTGARLNPSEQRVVTGAKDGVARVFDLEGRVLTRLEGHAGALTAAGYQQGTRGQGLAIRLFKTLTTKNDEGLSTRRPTPLGVLAGIADAREEELVAVIDTFRQPERAFLMPPAGEALDSSTIIDISHESLIQRWDRLGGWLQQEADSERRFRRLVQQVDEDEEHDTEYLLFGPILDDALHWRDRQQPNDAWAEHLGADWKRVDRFLDASRDERVRAEEERRKRQRWALFRRLAIPAAGLAAFMAWQEWRVVDLKKEVSADTEEIARLRELLADVQVPAVPDPRVEDRVQHLLDELHEVDTRLTDVEVPDAQDPSRIQRIETVLTRRDTLIYERFGLQVELDAVDAKLAPVEVPRVAEPSRDQRLDHVLLQPDTLRDELQGVRDRIALLRADLEAVDANLADVEVPERPEPTRIERIERLRELSEGRTDAGLAALRAERDRLATELEAVDRRLTSVVVPSAAAPDRLQRIDRVLSDADELRVALNQERASLAEVDRLLAGVTVPDRDAPTREQRIDHVLTSLSTHDGRVRGLLFALTRIDERLAAVDVPGLESPTREQRLDHLLLFGGRGGAEDGDGEAESLAALLAALRVEHGRLERDLEALQTEGRELDRGLGRMNALGLTRVERLADVESRLEGIELLLRSMRAEGETPEQQLEHVRERLENCEGPLPEISDSGYRRGWYFGASAGFVNARASGSRLDQDLSLRGHLTETALDDTDGGFKFWAGYRFEPPVSLELGYTNMDGIDSEIRSLVPVTPQLAEDVGDLHPITGKGMTFAAQLYLFENERFAATTRLGVWAWESTVDVITVGTTPVDIDRDGVDMFWGLGLQYRLWRNLDLRGDIERYILEDEELDFLSFGLQYSF